MTDRQPADGTRIAPAEQIAHLPRTAPDEGKQIHDQVISTLRWRLEDALTTDERKQWVVDLKAQAQQAVLDDGSSLSYHIGWPTSATYRPTERRYGIVAGLCALLESGVVEHGDPDLTVRDAAAIAVSADDWPYFPNIRTGAVLGAMNADQAARFYRICTAIRGDAAA